MNSDHDIQATALLNIKRQGDSAGQYTASRANDLQDEGAHAGAAVITRRNLV
jgi:hypothetical protein